MPVFVMAVLLVVGDTKVFDINVPYWLDPDNRLNLTLTCMIFAWAAVWVWVGALSGERAHSKPRILMAVSLTAGLLLNLAALFGIIPSDDRAPLSRGITWVFVLSVGWTAITGMRYGQKVRAAVETMEQIAETEAPGDGGIDGADDR